MADVGIMIEGQEGLDWARWRAICEDVERLGFPALRRSDHLFSVMGENDRECIDCWTSLALAAEWTHRIEIGPMVTPITFKLPAVLAREAASVDLLAGGRLILGVGTGWHAAEHEAFGIPFPEPLGARFKLLESAIDVIHQTWRTSNPRPPRGTVPLLIGGRGMRRTIPLAARHASEWNMFAVGPDQYREAVAALDGACREAGRRPEEVRRSTMGSVVVGRTRSEALERARALGELIPRLRGRSPDEVLGSVTFGGTVEEAAERMRPYVEAGCQRFMVQHFLLDDREHLDAIAEVAGVLAG